MANATDAELLTTEQKLPTKEVAEVRNPLATTTSCDTPQTSQYIDFTTKTSSSLFSNDNFTAFIVTIKSKEAAGREQEAVVLRQPVALLSLEPGSSKSIKEKLDENLKNQ